MGSTEYVTKISAFILQRSDIIELERKEVNDVTMIGFVFLLLYIGLMLSLFFGINYPLKMILIFIFIVFDLYFFDYGLRSFITLFLIVFGLLALCIVARIKDEREQKERREQNNNLTLN